VDDLENLSCRSLSLGLGEPVQPLQDRLHVLLSESFLRDFDCAMLREALGQLERTHSIFPS
jgi:hypothetical protein